MPSLVVRWTKRALSLVGPLAQFFMDSARLVLLSPSTQVGVEIPFTASRIRQVRERRGHTIDGHAVSDIHIFLIFMCVSASRSFRWKTYPCFRHRRSSSLCCSSRDLIHDLHW